MATDLADRHPSCIHRDDLVVEIREPTLVFGDQLRIECSGPISRHRQRHLRSACQNRLLRIAAAVIWLALNAVVVVNNGVSLYVVQRLLGHLNARTTQRYAHLANEMLSNAAETVAD